MKRLILTSLAAACVLCLASQVNANDNIVDPENPWDRTKRPIPTRKHSFVLCKEDTKTIDKEKETVDEKAQ